jgi:hypothetical protein
MHPVVGRVFLFRSVIQSSRRYQFRCQNLTAMLKYIFGFPVVISR